MNKSELIDAIAAGAGLGKAEAKKALDATVEAVKEELTKGGKIQLVGFGTFAVSERPAREGINRFDQGEDSDCCQEGCKVQGRC